MTAGRSRAGRGWSVLVAAASAFLVCACTATEVADEEEIAYSSSWFACKSRFSCVVVYDAFCTLTAVNVNSAIVYQDWSRQEVVRRQERTVCPPPDRQNELAGCVRGRCSYPFGFGASEPESP